MSRLKNIDASNWEEFVRHSPAAVLLIGKSDCDNCARWSQELEAYLEAPDRWPQVRFGKVLLDKPGLAGFKRANPWLAELDVLPFNVIFVDGERSKSFAGGGVERLETRLGRILEPETG